MDPELNNSTNSTGLDDGDVTLLCGSGLYFLLSVLTVVAFFLHHEGRPSWTPTIHNVFYLFSFSSLIRGIWSVVSAVEGSSVATFLLNRSAFLLFFSAFTTIIVLWAISYNKQLDTDVSSLRRRLKWIFLITNLLLYLAQIAIIIAFMADEEGDLSEREGKPLYEGMKQVSPSKKKESNTRNEQIKTSFFLLIEAANIIIIAITLFIISCGFVVYRSNTLALFLWSAATYLMDKKLRIKFIVKILLVSSLYTSLFGVRVSMFMYRPITDDYLPDVPFRLFAYIIPEFVPTIIELWLLRPQWMREKRWFSRSSKKYPGYHIAEHKEMLLGPAQGAAVEVIPEAD